MAENGGCVHDDHEAKRRQVDNPLPETGCPETAKEFSKRIKRLILHGPRVEREEGERIAHHGPITSPQPAMQTSQLPDTEDTSNTHTTEGEPAPTVDKPTEPVMASSDEPLLDYITSSADGIHLQDEIRGRYNEDPFFGNILTNPKQFKDFELEDGLILLRDQGRSLLCIPNVIVNGRSVREIVIAHAHSLLAHLSSHKTASLLRDHVWWKTLLTDVQKYCDSCMTCKRSKPANQKRTASEPTPGP
ncbi:hypothetical protein GY45DRAFT_1263438 [Cubamyces sp. BRFM 1775]|nr:hypothetical protein GY45DRAFT_1263438 [Cubamyces sp. BRFM 1775]